MAEARVVVARREHALELAPRMRREDAAEVQASGGWSPLEALEASLAASSVAWTLVIDGEVAGMFGLVSLPYGAQVWLLTGEAVSRQPRAFLRVCRPVVASLLATFPVLVNAIDARYEAALRWARWLGFEVGEPIPYGVNGEPFCPVVIRRK